MALGTAVVGLGGSLGGGFFVYTLSTDGETFWSAPGFVSIALLAFGLICLVIPSGETKERSGPRGLTQRSGDNSSQIQAAGDVTLTNSSLGSSAVASKDREQLADGRDAAD